MRNRPRFKLHDDFNFESIKMSDISQQTVERESRFEINESARQANEQQRELAESERALNEEERELNETERISKDSERDSKIDSKVDVSELELYAKKEQEDWITPTLVNGATAKEGFPVGYMKDEMGFVHFRGKLIVPSYGRLTLSLPVGYRPSSTIHRLCYVHRDKFGRVEIQYPGGVYPGFPYDANTEYDLSSITFKADR